MQLEAIKTDRLYMKVAEQLRSLIENGFFKVGDRFPSEKELALKLEVSRPTIREAMIALELSGLIDIRSGVGTYIKDTKGKKNNTPVAQGIGPFEILEMRYFLEPEICALAALRIKEEEIEKLKSILESMADPKISPESFEKVDNDLHTAIAEACGNEAMEETIKWLWKMRTESIFVNCIQAEIKKQGLCVEEHRKIVLAIIQREPEKARIAMKKHLENATTTIGFDL